MEKLGIDRKYLSVRSPLSHFLGSRYSLEWEGENQDEGQGKREGYADDVRWK